MKKEDLNALKDKIVKIALENDFITGIILFGSIARNEENEKSDIDLLILWENLKVEDSYSYIYKIFSKRFPYKSLTIIDMEYSSFFNIKKATPLYLNIIWDGFIIYDKHGKLHDFISKIRKELKAKGFERKKLENTIFGSYLNQVKK